MASRKEHLRVVALMDDDLIPPDSLEHPDDRLQAPWRMEWDVVSTLQSLGHTVQRVGIYDDITVLKQAVQEVKPHITFNMFEQFDGNALFDQHVVSYLELLKVPYTGCNPRGLTLARDKALSKKVLAYHRIQVPQFSVFPKGRKIQGTKRLRYPLFVKSLVEEGSTGISRASIVYDEKKLIERLQFIHESVGTAAIAEEYIEGRELYVGIIGNHRLLTLPIWELTFENLPDGVPAIATGRVKWNRKHQKKLGVRTAAATDIAPALRSHIEQVSKRSYRALCLSGYARLDFRLTAEGKLYLLEANPNPDISIGEDFADSAKAEGITYKKLLARMLTLGLAWTPGADG